ncbi:hypothetical protein BY458DRAFT_515354 [Sporodiniella umbellata]|nr:hypothetical protein BY458DRAFT_515354 [Sporodiniella umbellata]
MMAQNFLLSIALFCGLISMVVFAAPADGCKGFRITSPTKSGLQWTSGQCYQVSYDVGANSPGTSLSVDVYNAQTNAKVSTVVKKQATNSLGATPQFNLNVPKTGDYYYQVTFNNGGSCAPIKSVTFHVTYNPNSPPAQC